MELLIIGIFFMAVVALLGYTVIAMVQDDGPEGRVRARRAMVVAKRTQLTIVSKDLPSTTTYLVTFQFANLRRVLEFVVSRREYEALTEGEIGSLQYRGWEFVSFEPAAQPSKT